MENIAFWYRKSFLGKLCQVFQEQGLQCFEFKKHNEVRKQHGNEDLKTSFTKMRMLMKAMCENHNLPLALAWVPCGDCNALLRDLGVGSCSNDQFTDFIMFSQAHHLRKEQRVVGRGLSSPNLSYCTEYPLVPYARQFRLSACFAICLQSCYAGNDVCVIEFLLPTGNKDGDDSCISLSRILGTIKEIFKNFKLASGQDLGEELSVAVIDFHNGQKLHSVHIIPADRSLPSLEPLQNGEVTMQLHSLNQPVTDAINSAMNFVNTEENYVLVSSSEEGGTRKGTQRTGVKIDVSLEDILHCSNMSRDNAASELEVSISTLKRACRDYGIHRWPPHNITNIHTTHPFLVDQERIPQLSSDQPSNQISVSVAHLRPLDIASQDANMVTIKAKYGNKITLKFRLSMSSGVVELRQQVAIRLNLEAGTYKIRYKDEDGELILLACDEDLQDCIHASKSLGNTSVVVLLEPK